MTNTFTKTLHEGDVSVTATITIFENLTWHVSYHNNVMPSQSTAGVFQLPIKDLPENMTSIDMTLGRNLQTLLDLKLARDKAFELLERYGYVTGDDQSQVEKPIEA